MKDYRDKKFRRGDYVVVVGNTEKRGEVWFKRGNIVFVKLNKPLLVGRGLNREHITILAAHVENVMLASHWDAHEVFEKEARAKARAA
jgi:hypothetical protein